MKKEPRLLEAKKHTQRAIREANRNGGIGSIKRTKQGTQYNYKNGTGYWVGK